MFHGNPNSACCLSQRYGCMMRNNGMRETCTVPRKQYRVSRSFAFDSVAQRSTVYIPVFQEIDYLQKDRAKSFAKEPRFSMLNTVLTTLKR